MIADEMKVDKLQTGKKIQSLMEKKWRFSSGSITTDRTI